MSALVDRLVPKNPDAPHRAIIWVEATVQEVLPTGACTGMPVHVVKRFPLAISGQDRDIAIRKLNETLEGWKNQCG